MGTIFEDLVRRFNEENNEEAGEHWTTRDAVELMAQLVFQPIRDRVESGTYLLYDGAIGTGGMLTIAEQTLRAIAEENGKRVSTHLYAQEVNNETYAICKADMLLKGERNIDDNILGGPQHSTLSNAPSGPRPSTSCSATRPTVRAGAATWTEWEGRRASRTRAS